MADTEGMKEEQSRQMRAFSLYKDLPSIYLSF